VFSLRSGVREVDNLNIYTPVSPTEKDTDLLVRVAGDPEQARQHIDARLTAVAPGAVRQMFSPQTMAAQRTFALRAIGWTAS
jgi:hypothetical protein